MKLLLALSCLWLVAGCRTEQPPSDVAPAPTPAPPQEESGGMTVSEDEVAIGPGGSVRFATSRGEQVIHGPFRGTFKTDANGDFVITRSEGGARVTGTGPVVSENRTVAAFEAVDASASQQVTVHCGDGAPRVEIRAQKQILPKVKAIVRGGVLRFVLQGNFVTTQPISISVYTPRVTRVKASSGATLSVLGLKSDQLTVSSTSSATVRLEGSVTDLDLSASSGGQFTADGLTLRTLTVQASSSAQVALAGSADRADLRLASGASLEGQDLTVDALSANLSGSASAHVHVRSTLLATATSGASLTYTGRPTVERVRTSGAGAIERQEP